MFFEFVRSRNLITKRLKTLIDRHLLNELLHRVLDVFLRTSRSWEWSLLRRGVTSLINSISFASIFILTQNQTNFSKNRILWNIRLQVDSGLFSEIFRRRRYILWCCDFFSRIYLLTDLHCHLVLVKRVWSSALFVNIFDIRSGYLGAAKSLDNAGSEICDFSSDFFLVLDEHHWIVELFICLLKYSNKLQYRPRYISTGRCRKDFWIDIKPVQMA